MDKTQASAEEGDGEHRVSKPCRRDRIYRPRGVLWKRLTSATKHGRCEVTGHLFEVWKGLNEQEKEERGKKLSSAIVTNRRNYDARRRKMR